MEANLLCLWLFSLINACFLRLVVPYIMTTHMHTKAKKLTANVSRARRTTGTKNILRYVCYRIIKGANQEAYNGCLVLVKIETIKNLFVQPVLADEYAAKIAVASGE